MTTMRTLPDTYAFIEFFNGTKQGEKVRAYLKKDVIYLSTICIYEIRHVISKRHSKKRADDFLRSLMINYKIVPVDEEIAMLAADIKNRYNMPMADSLIYATAKRENARVLSGCKHFKKVKERDVIVLK